jgi:hypothetical protein
MSIDMSCLSTLLCTTTTTTAVASHHELLTYFAACCSCFAVCCSYFAACCGCVMCLVCVRYLTLVGGGVFGNPLRMIVQEIVRAHRLYANHFASQLQEVCLCVYSEKQIVDVRNLLDELMPENNVS